MSPAILHIGYPKTATKWFQQVFYPAIEGTFLVSRDDVFKSIAFNDVFSFDATVVKSKLEDLASSKRLVICDEILVGGLDIGFGNGEFAHSMAIRIHEMFPDAKVIIFIRNQHNALESAYSHYIMSGGTYSPSRFLGVKPIFHKPFMGYHLFNPGLLEYDRVIRLYISLFGSENVHIFLYEDFEKNPTEFIEQFCKTLQLSISEKLSFNRLNSRYSAIALQKQRFLNRFTLGNTPYKHYFFNIPFIYRFSRHITLSIDRIMALPRFTFSGKIHCWIDSRYRESNLKLTEWIAIDRLKQWGYPL